MLPAFWGEPAGPVGRLRYACCGLVVVCSFGLVALRVESHETGAVVSDSDTAVLVDLPPALANSAPAGDQIDLADRPPPVAASMTRLDPPPQDASKPMPADRADAILPKPAPPKVEPAPVPPAPDGVAPAQAAQVLGGSEAPTRDAPLVDSEPTRRASMQAISRWQQAMVAKLEATKHLTAARPREKGIVEIAFAIDRRGNLVRHAIAKSSGNRSLDDLALRLIEAAAPFAPPPDAMGEAALAFTIPIRFNSR